MLKGKDNEIVYRFIDKPFLYLLGHYRYRAGACAAGGPGNEQESIGFRKMFGGSYRLDNLVGIVFGYFSSQLIYFTHAVTTGLSTANEDSMLVIRFYGV